jgi:hypothetical protein
VVRGTEDGEREKRREEDEGKENGCKGEYVCVCGWVCVGLTPFCGDRDKHVTKREMSEIIHT